MVRIAINNDLKHYSLIVRNTKAYKTTKNIAIITGALFLINSICLVAETARTHKAEPLLVLLVSAFFLPLWTAQTISYDDWRSHMWMPSWI